MPAYTSGARSSSRTHRPQYNKTLAMPTGQILDRNPASADELDSHGPVANAIASLMDQCVGGKAVAILGGWGSGKSTIVNLLKKKIEADGVKNDKRTRLVVIFDAWAHQGDPLRLSFLDWLLDQLDAAKWLK